jgi:hypothetical protein
MLSVVIWADQLIAQEVDLISMSGRRSASRAISRLDSLLVSVRPVADARSWLARLNGELLLAGFLVWAGRQRAVMQRLSASSPRTM